MGDWHVKFPGLWESKEESCLIDFRLYDFGC